MHPTITSISPSTSGDLGGNTVTISGHGFAATCSNNAVFLDGVACAILTCSNTQITCVAGPRSSVTASRSGSSRGVVNRVFSSYSAGTNFAQDARYPNSPSQTLIDTRGLVGYGVNVADYYTQIVDTLFVAPYTANYTFFVGGDDWHELQFSPTDSAANLSVIASSSNWEPQSNYYLYAGQKSAPVALQAGSAYYLRARQIEWGGGDYLQVAVRIHDVPTAYAEQKYSSMFERQRLAIRPALVRESQILTFTSLTGTFYVGGPLGFDSTRAIRLNVANDRNVLADAVAVGFVCVLWLWFCVCVCVCVCVVLYFFGGGFHSLTCNYFAAIVGCWNIFWACTNAQFFLLPKSTNPPLHLHLHHRASSAPSAQAWASPTLPTARCARSHTTSPSTALRAASFR